MPFGTVSRIGREMGVLDGGRRAAREGANVGVVFPPCGPMVSMAYV